MYSVQTNAMYTIDENGKHSIEINYKDSDGIDTSTYSEGDDITEVIADIAEKLDKQIAEINNAKANEEESRMLDSQINDLESQINDLKIQLDVAREKKNNLKTYTKDNKVNDLNELDFTKLINKNFNKYFWDLFN